MDKNELAELASNPDLISGIYNYCDRWCERCPFTSRCLLYATERADGTLDDPELNDENNARFWQKLEQIFKEVRQMIVDWAAEEGIDVETLKGEELGAEREQQKYDADHHQLSEAARDYAKAVQQWFNEEFAVEETVHDDLSGDSKSAAEDISVSDAIEIVRWYQFLIAAKVFRALMGLEEESLEDESSETAEIVRAARAGDSDGSAKIALISIDRSLSAWRVLHSELPEKAESILPLLFELEKLRRGLEHTFPEARDFIRPGFDEVDSEFLS
jgi:hypothetical protein